MFERKRHVFMKRLYQYARDYTITPDGETRYIGILYEFLNPDCEVIFRRLAIQSGVIAALMILCGLLPVVSMQLSAFVIFPYGADLIAGFVLLAACIRLVRIPSPMERRAFNGSYARLLPLSVVVAVASAVAFVGHLVFILSHLWLGVLIWDVIYGVSMAVAAVLGVLIFLDGKKIRYKCYDA